MAKPILDDIAQMPESRRARGAALHRLVATLFPKATMDMSYKMPTYRVGENFIAWGNKKSHLSVYTCSAQRIADFRLRHPEIRSGVGCLNFRDADDVPLADLKRVVRNALAPGAKVLAAERAARATARGNSRSRKR